MTRRPVWIGLITLGVLCLLLILLAPESGRKTSGSTYSRAPEGYLGWYEQAQSQGITIERWQRPIEEILPKGKAGGQTLVRIFSDNVERFVAEGTYASEDWLETWLAEGNRVITLGIREPVSEARFRTQQNSPHGKVEVHTTRRQTDLTGNRAKLLSDRYGAIVWRETMNPGTLVFATTPHLAANAYQDAPGNYDFFTELVTLPGEEDTQAGTLWVDEYLHGYKDADVLVEEVAGSWSSYLSNTPVAVAVIQLSVLIGLFLLAQNRRSGTLATIRNPQVDNSQAYIDALAGVLRKANSYAFVANTIARAERQKVQQALGLGHTPVDDQTLMTAWRQQTGKDDAGLRSLLTPPQIQAQAADKTFSHWLTQLQTLHHQLKK
ncbi:MAG: DUF4350 domain-containing protein [Cyanobacteria bacterium P01_A01_bin.105]